MPHNVKVQTWGTNDKTNNGVSNFIEQVGFGGNVGHASIVMSLPINEESKKWIEQYCYEKTFEEYKASLPEKWRNSLTFDDYLKTAPQRIPITQKKDTTLAARYNEDGALVETDDIASESEYFQVEFSWWPHPDKKLDSFSLSTTEQDMIYEREGRHFEYNDPALQSEQRRHSGLISSQVMDYAPATIIHQRDLTDTQLNRFHINAQLDKIKEYLNVEESLLKKVDELKSAKIKGKTVSLMCKNIGLDNDEFINSYLEKNPGKVNLDDFKKSFKERIGQHMDELKKQKEELQQELIKMGQEMEQSPYVVEGLPPDHLVTLPYATEGRRGLSPEAMLKKMRELTEPDAAPFHLAGKNCSKTTTEILTAGAEHDPLLRQTLNEQALGFFGTPQQVLGNVQRARDIIDHNKESTLQTQLENFSPLNQAMGKLISVSMDPKASILARIAVIPPLIPVALVKLGSVALKSLFNPTESMKNILSADATIAKLTNSTIVKGLVGIGSIIPLAVLAPFALVEQGLKQLAKPFKTLANWMSKKESPQPSENQITTPNLSTTNVDEAQKTSHHSMMSGLMNSKIAGRINEHTRKLTGGKTPEDILMDFEITLDYDYDAVVVPDFRINTTQI